ncbi:DUF317 domain-containing protein [Streptomyces sp. NPDC048717]|uniref:DUF317 domain-containing protein n=1 Tax=Streptomyces sp. NPDC048717 TaxID=3154928 RepID=UPI003439F310
MSAPQPVDGDVYVNPRYLAGSSGTGDASFAPVAHWPHHHLDEGPHQLVVTSPDHRIRIGWAGDDHDLWTISAAPDAVLAARWTATANQNTPAELVGALTAQLAQDWAEGADRFLAAPSVYWARGVRPLLDAGWTQHRNDGFIYLTSPDGHAGADIDLVQRNEEYVTLWAGPDGWGTRAEISFTTQAPDHLIAATAQAFTNPAPVARWRQHLAAGLAARAQLTPITPPAPTPRDIRPRIATRRPATAASVPRWSTTTPAAPARPAARR